MSTPNVSIGLPVRNGDAYLRVALDSLVNQSYQDIEFVISDNASTDGTPEICAEYARHDPRIRYHRSDSNLGAAENFNRVFRLSRGKYFMWAAHDDRWGQTYVSRCVEGLDANPNVVLCATTIRFVDALGSEVDASAPSRKIIGDYNRLDTCSMDLIARVKELTAKNNWYATYGLMRSEVLRKTHLFQSSFGGDVQLLMELLFHGETMILPEALFDYRIIEKSAERQLEDISGKATLGTLKECTELAKLLLGVIARSQFSAPVKSKLREDLLENVSFANRRWAARIRSENPSGDPNDRFVARVQIRELLEEGHPARAMREVRERATRARKRFMFMFMRWLDTHLLWRLKAKA